MKQWIELNRPNSLGMPPLYAFVPHIRVVREYEMDPKNSRIEFDNDHHLVVQETASEVMSMIEASRHDSEED
jgi:hypothetical protein